MAVFENNVRLAFLYNNQIYMAKRMRPDVCIFNVFPQMQI